MDLDLLDIDHLDRLDRSQKTDLDNWDNLQNSSGPTAAGLENLLDEVLQTLYSPSSALKPAAPVQKKRGRKPIRPDDPIKKKTEVKDKYWLRVFRGYMKIRYREISHLLSPEEQSFWEEYLSAKGVPYKGTFFPSYGKKYKNHLFSQPSFVSCFQGWFHVYGEIELSRKYPQGSDLWFTYFDYANKELLGYVPTGCSAINRLDLTISSVSRAVVKEETIGSADFYMVPEINEMIESFLS